MLKNLLTKVFGDRYQRELKEVTPFLDKISEIYPGLIDLSDEQLRERVSVIKQELREKLSPSEEKLEKLEESYQTEADENRRNEFGNQIDSLRAGLNEETQSLLW